LGDLKETSQADCSTIEKGRPGRLLFMLTRVHVLMLYCLHSNCISLCVLCKLFVNYLLCLPGDGALLHDDVDSPVWGLCPSQAQGEGCQWP